MASDSATTKRAADDPGRSRHFDAAFAALLHGDERQRDRGQQTQGILPISAEHQRRHDGHENAAQRAAGGNRQVKQRRMLGRRLRLRQLAVAHHAAHEQRGRIDRQLLPDFQVVALKQGKAAEQHGHGQQGGHQVCADTTARDRSKG